MKPDRIELAVWGALTVLLLAPVWGLAWFPTQDGPSHVENARILLRLAAGAPAPFGEWFVINTAPSPNWLGHALLAALLTVLPPLVAEKVVLSACLVGLPFAVRYALTGLRADGGRWAVLAFPLAFNCLLHYGFYNFCLSLPLFFVALGVWVRGAGMLVAASALAVLYGCHVVSWSLALAAMALFRPRSIPRLALAAMPSLALAVWFLASRPGGGAPAPVSFSQRLYGLTHFTTSVFSYGEAAQWTGLALAVFFVLAAATLRRAGWAAPAFSLLVLLLYFAAPQGAAGGSTLLERLNLYFFLSLLLWIGGARGRTAVEGGAVAFTVLLLALNVPWYREANRRAAEMRSVASHVPEGSVFLPLLYDARGPGPLGDLYGEMLRHVPSWIALERGAVNLDNYEAQTDLFPVRFAPGRNPGVFAGAMEDSPPRVRLDSPWIEGVLVWDPLGTASPLPSDFTSTAASPGGAARFSLRRHPDSKTRTALPRSSF